MSIRCSSSATKNERLFVGFGHLRPTLAFPQPHSCSRPRPRPRPILASARRRNKDNSPVPSSKRKKQSLSKDVGEEEDLDDDAFEALFQLLAEDLKNDDLSLVDDDEDEITEEELAKLERELEETLGDNELMGLFNSMVDDASEKEVKGNAMEEEEEDEEEDELEEEDYDDDEEEDESEEEGEQEQEQEQVELKRWQLKRLAYALKSGRRKTSIKTLAADLCLDRAVVLKLLRDPPPNLLMLSATLPDEPEPTILEPETTSVETIASVRETDTTKSEAKEKVPVHVKQRGWSSQKRIKKVHVETLERVYKRTKRPTNAMVSNIVHVTSLPRKVVVKWFEDKRAKDDVPDHRRPYQRSTSETVFTS